MGQQASCCDCKNTKTEDIQQSINFEKDQELLKKSNVGHGSQKPRIKEEKNRYKPLVQKQSKTNMLTTNADEVADKQVQNYGVQQPSNRNRVQVNVIQDYEKFEVSGRDYKSRNQGQGSGLGNIGNSQPIFYQDKSKAVLDLVRDSQRSHPYQAQNIAVSNRSQRSRNAGQGIISKTSQNKIMSPNTQQIQQELRLPSQQYNGQGIEQQSKHMVLNFKSNCMIIKANTEFINKIQDVGFSCNINPKVLDSSWMQNFEVIKLEKKEIFSELYLIKMKAQPQEFRYLRKIKKVIFNKCESGIEEFRFQLEELILLDHPNIAQIYDYREDFFNFYLIIEHQTGGKLFDRIEGLDQISENLSAEIIRQLLSTVVYLHSKSHYQKFISPESIYLESDTDDLKHEAFNIKLYNVDLQAAINTANLTYYTIPLYYFSPEQIAQSSVSEKSDVWACGVLLSILLVGMPPQHSNSIQSGNLIKSLASGEIDFSHQEYQILQDSALELLKKLLCQDPDKRIKAVTALNDKWLLNLTRSRRSIQKKFYNQAKTHLVKYQIAELNLLQRLSDLSQVIRVNIEEKNLMMSVFEAKDFQSTGFLQRQLIKKMYNSYCGDIIKENNIDFILSKCPSKMDGTIDYAQVGPMIFKENEDLYKDFISEAFENLQTYKIALMNHSGNPYQVLNSVNFEYKKGLLHQSEVSRMLAAIFICNNQFESLIQEFDENGDGYLNQNDIIKLVINISTQQHQ